MWASDVIATVHTAAPITAGTRENFIAGILYQGALGEDKRVGVRSPSKYICFCAREMGGSRKRQGAEKRGAGRGREGPIEGKGVFLFEGSVGVLQSTALAHSLATRLEKQRHVMYNRL